MRANLTTISVCFQSFVKANLTTISVCFQSFVVLNEKYCIIVH